LSEVLNAEVTSSEEGGLSRRRIVKGAAWSMPVIAAAIAAPAASASGGTTTPTLSVASGVAVGISISKQQAQGAGVLRTGQGPLNVVIRNTSGGTVTGSIGIVATVDTGTVGTGLAVKTLDGVIVGTPSFSSNHVSTSTFSITGDQTTERSISFFYVDGTGKAAPVAGQKYTFTVTFTVGSASYVLPTTVTMTIP
jgi:hypothetical protein